MIAGSRWFGDLHERTWRWCSATGLRRCIVRERSITGTTALLGRRGKTAESR